MCVFFANICIINSYTYHLIIIVMILTYVRAGVYTAGSLLPCCVFLSMGLFSLGGEGVVRPAGGEKVGESEI